MPRFELPKIQWQRKHFRERALLRYGLDATREHQGNIIRMIQRGNAKFVNSRSNRTSVFQVDYLDREMLVVYDSKRKTLVTALSKENENEQARTD
jgi:hypothetical protein